MTILVVALALPFLVVSQDDMGDVHKQTILRLSEEVFNQGNLEVIDELFAPDYVGHNPADGSEGSLEDFKFFISDSRSAMPDYESSVDLLVAEGDLASFRLIERGTFENEFLSLPGVPPTGEAIELVTYAVVRFNEDGQIAEEWEMFDSLTFLIQVGILPPLEELAIGTPLEALMGG